MSPLVSICMPTLNSAAFLAQRLQSIGGQTLRDWELVVVDSQSNDGTLEMIEVFAREHDGKVRIHQGPRDGIYTNINRSIRLAQGRYIYIATSDDTMALDCLEKMAAALEAHPDCGLAHCRLKRMHADGSEETPDWWSRESIFARSCGNLLDQTHVRKAPFDGLLHLLGFTVYISLTQLLIRRSLFDRVGYFESAWGSVSDYNWDMRAALATDTVHVTDTWASWRMHADQATASAGIGQAEHTWRIESMIEHALADRRGDLPPRIHEQLVLSHASRWAETRCFLREQRETTDVWRWRLSLTKRVLSGSWVAHQYLSLKLSRGGLLTKALPGLMRTWLERLMGQPVLVPQDNEPKMGKAIGTSVTRVTASSATATPAEPNL